MTPQPAPKKLPQFLTVRQVAEMLHKSESGIYYLVSQRKIPFRKAGRTTVFLLDEILDWAKESALPP